MGVLDLEPDHDLDLYHLWPPLCPLLCVLSKHGALNLLGELGESKFAFTKLQIVIFSATFIADLVIGTALLQVSLF